MVESLSNDLFKVDYVRTATDLGGSQTEDSSQIIQAGYPLGTFYTFKFEGFNSDGLSIFLDKNGDITTNPKAVDDYYSENSQPKLNYSWNNNMSYRKWTLDLTFYGVAVIKMLNNTSAKLNQSYSTNKVNQPIYILEFGQPAKDVKSNYVSDRYIENVGYFRLGNFNLNYNFPIKTNNYIKDLNLYFSAYNLFTITKYKGVNPEVGIGGITPGIDNNNIYPNTRSFQLGVKVNL